MGKRGTDDGTGETLLAIHRHAWREDPEPLDLAVDDVIELLPNLIRSGSVGLAWPRLRHRAAEYGAAGAALEAAYQSQVEHNRAVEREIARVVSTLHDAAIRPVLIKGLAVGRLYPAPAIRAAGDIDLVVPDADYATAQEVLSDVHLSFHGDPAARRQYAEDQRRRRADASPATGKAIDVDLHSFSRWYGAVDEDFFADARIIPLGNVDIAVPQVEDHLRALCLHFLRHAAVRPLRLCDIALLLETRADDIDWDRCLRGNRRETEQVIVTLGLAHELLGAEINDTPSAISSPALPTWLVPAVVQRWEHGTIVRRPLLPEILTNPAGIACALARRWPDPITATVQVRGPYFAFPRFPIQLAAFLQSAASYLLRRLSKQLQMLFNHDTSNLQG